MNIEVIKLSIIVPIYNGERFIRECISSIISQSYQNWELLLVDDGSNDNSNDICLNYAQLDTRIKSFSKPNSGQLKTREYGIEKSTGDYCLFLDVDDYLLDGALEKIVFYVEKYHPDCIVFGIEVETATGTNSIWGEQSNIPQLISDKNDLYKKTILNQEYNSMCRKAIKRSIVTSIDLDTSSIRYGEDFLQSLYIYKNVKNVLFIPDVLYFYRLNQNSVSHNNKFIRYEPFILVDKYLDDFVVAEKCFSDNNSIYISFCINNISDLVIGILSNKGWGSNIKIIRRLRNESYIQSKLKGKNYKYSYGYRKIVAFLFQKKMYFFICVLAKFKLFLKEKGL